MKIGRDPPKTLALSVGTFIILHSSDKFGYGHPEVYIPLLLDVVFKNMNSIIGQLIMSVVVK